MATPSRNPTVLLFSVLPAILFAPLFQTSAADAPDSLLGFRAAGAAKQLALEKNFDAGISAADQRVWLERMSSEPNQVGSPHDKANADFMLELFREWGWDAHLETFDVLYPTPKNIALELVSPSQYKALLHEPAVDGDRTSGNTRDALPPWLAFGADGDVTAELVYVNQGMPEDYKELARHGISVTGRIVIARYGGGWRGLKPKLAHQHGAIGCIIYSDPRDDGYASGEAWPKGGTRPAMGVQRGSVADMPIYPGDPLTPGIGATKDAKRLPISEARTVLKIPALPISYSDAQPLLAALAGPVAPASWRGGLPITYRLGPGPAKVHLTVAADWTLKPIYDVIATLKGSEHPDEWIIRGNHHDGWVFGAWDPLSGNVALMSEAKAIGALAKSGWRPRRTLVYASWDGEEPALIGSTEWAETHANELRQKAVLYINSDDNGRGFMRAGGSPSMQALVNQVAAVVPDPETGTNALARLRARFLIDGHGKGASPEDRKQAKRIADGATLPLYALGSGSDFSVFLQHLGIASVDIRYGGEDESGGVYHSTYDSFDHYIRFGDPDFAYGVALSKTIGRVVLRTADSDVLPMRFGDFAENIAQYADDLHHLADDLREATHTQHRLLDDGAFKLAADPTETLRPPERDTPVPFLNFAPLDNAVAKLSAAAKSCDQALIESARGDYPVSAAQLSSINDLLQNMEQTLIHPQGLPTREWYQHMIFAPGLHTGYAAKTLPGIREAIEERHWQEVDQYMIIVAGVLNNYSARLDQISTLLSSQKEGQTK